MSEALPKMRLRRTPPPDSEPVELAALADGTLSAKRRTQLEAAVQASPELTALLAEQHRAVDLVRTATDGVTAPASLRSKVAVERARRAPVARRRQIALRAGVALAAGAAAVALALSLPGGAGGPAVAEAAELAALPATEPAPAADPDEPTLLAESVESVPFPSWEDEFEWLSSGARRDDLDDRSTTTVFYDKQGKRIGYTIVGGDALEVPEEADLVRRDDVDLHVFEADGRTVVTWERDGHTCVLSGTDVDADVLVKLAAWQGEGSVPF
jgi:hypothetical protein